MDWGKGISIFVIIVIVIWLILTGLEYHEKAKEREDLCKGIGYDNVKLINGGFDYRCCKDTFHESGIGFEEECTGIIKE